MASDGWRSRQRLFPALFAIEDYSASPPNKGHAALPSTAPIDRAVSLCLSKRLMKHPTKRKIGLDGDH